jgi:hypothetical protein
MFPTVYPIFIHVCGGKNTKMKTTEKQNKQVIIF